jgi:hypothetical protein
VKKGKTMKTFAWIYIVAYCIDALVFIIATFVPEAENLFSIISGPFMFLNIAVFILACIGKMKPRIIFLIMSGIYMLILLLGISMVIQLVAKFGPSVTSQNLTIAFLSEQFPSYYTVRWVIMIVSLLTAGYGIHTYRKFSLNTEQMAQQRTC